LTQLEIAAPECVADDFGGEIVALNLKNGVYFSMRDLAAGLWTDLAAGHPVETVLGTISAHDPSLEAEAQKVIERLCKESLMRPAATTRDAAMPLAVGEALAAGRFSLELQVYDDMQDLIMLDPVHDVEITEGWPAARADS
jgi:hypothetical protein